MMRTRTLAVLMGSFVAVLAFMAAVFAPKAQAQTTFWTPQSQAAVAAPQLNFKQSNPLQVSTPIPGITCNVNVTTTSSVQGNYTYTASFLPNVATYTGLALVNAVSSTVYPGNSVTPGSQWFVLGNVVLGNIYSFEVIPDQGSNNYNLGMEIYTTENPPVLYRSNVETGDGNTARIVTTFPTTGPYYIRIFQISGFCTGSTYRMNYGFEVPTNTPTHTPSPTRTTGPSPTPYSGAPNSDKFEPNNNFDQATTIGLNVKYDALNFVQWDVNSTDWDNDFFKVRVKPGMLVTCRTLDLKPGTDTNLILYDVNMNGINGQDDFNRAAGDLSSSVSYFVTYEGWLFGLVGEGFSRSASEQATTGYSYECTITSQYTATPGPTATDRPDVSPQPTRTPIPTETPIPSPTLTPVPPFVKVNPLPTATLPGLPTTAVPVSLLTYYDANSNNKYDPGEGIVGISARVFDLTTGQLLAQGLTDTTGRVSFTVNAPSAVQLVVPYLNRSEIILPAGKAVTIRVSPSELPGAIP